jgi:hypothetical protein
MSRVDLCVLIQWWWCVLDGDGVLGVDVEGVVVCSWSTVALAKSVSLL